MTSPVAVVVVTFRSREHVGRCLASVRAAGVAEVVVVDNASGDGTADVARAADPTAVVVESPRNLGFGAGNNLGVARCASPLVLFLNPDAELQPGALAALVSALDTPAVGAAGPRTLNADGTPQLSFGPVLTLRSEVRQRRLVLGVRERRPEALAEVDALTRQASEPAWLSASCLLVRREALQAVGGFDEGFFLYEEDVDLGYRIRAAGWRLVHVPSATVLHHLGRSAAAGDARVRLEYHRSHLRLYRKHNPMAEQLALRLGLALRGTLDVLRGRREGAALVRLALRS